MLKALKKLFGAAEAKSEVSGVGTPKNLRDLVGFVEYVTRLLVDYPDEVRVSSEDKGDDSVIQVRCRKEDIGKIVGKKGKTIMAIRSLVSGAAGRLQKRISVEVLD